MDSRSCLTTLLHFNDSPNVEFSFDVAILTKNRNGDYMRLIHNKNAFCFGYDQYTWNEVPKPHDVKEKADAIKAEGLWQEVRDRYVGLKNMYLSRQTTRILLLSYMLKRSTKSITNTSDKEIF